MANVLGKADVYQLTKTRKLLKEMLKRVAKEGWTSDAFEHGRLAEAIDTAEDGIFNVLNVAASYCNDDDAANALK